MKIRHLIFIVLFLFADSSYGQSSDTGKVSRIIKYGEAIYDSKPDSALLLFKNAEILADKYLNSEKNAKFLFSLSQLKSLAINNQGFLLYEDDVNAALVKFLYALKIREQISDLKNLPESYANLAILYTNLSQFDKALFYSFKAMKYDEMHNVNHLGYSYSTIASIYYGLKDADNAIKYNLKALEVRQKLNDLTQIAISSNNLNAAYILKGDYVSAQKYILMAIKIWEEKNALKNLAFAYSNYGAIYQKLDRRDSALYYILKALKIREEIKDQRGLAAGYNNIARIYYELGEFDNAEKYGLKSFYISEKIKFPTEIQNASEILRRVYDYKKDDVNAYKYYKIYVTMRDSIQNVESKKLAYEKDVQYEYGKKDALTQAELARREVQILKNKQSLIILEAENDLKELSLSKSSIELIAKKNETAVQQNAIEVLNKDKALKEAEATKSEAELKFQRILTFSSAGIGVLFLAFLLVTIRGYRQKKKSHEIIELQKLIVEEKHREITDSINYAERIQRSFLATNALLSSNLNNYFILFKPKAIVSGDFYWATVLENGNFALVTADSTGHGVPGAIMSILNITSLEKAVEKNVEPSDILNFTRKNIIERLKKDGSKEGGKDGMDCSLLSLDFKSNTLTYSAANNPIWILRNSKENELYSKSEMLEFNADKMPVGKHDKDDISFSQKTIALCKGDLIYTFTDGYADQFGGPKGKKFKYKQLQDILLANANKTMDEQKIVLENAIASWQGNLEQIDDILVIGVRF